MSEPASTIAFLAVWLCAVAYVLSVLRLAQLVRRLKAGGRAKEAPDIVFGLPDGIAGLVWLVTGRYATLGDPLITRWSNIARLLLFLGLPIMLAQFAALAIWMMG